MSTLIHHRVELARQGQNPTVLARLESGWAVIGDVQVLNGYCLLLSDPVVPTLNDLPLRERELFLRDMSLLGDAILDATGATRINYEILGNSEHALHAHVIPRYAAEPDQFRTGPAWFYDFAKAPRFDPQNPTYALLKTKIEAALQARLAK